MSALSDRIRDFLGVALVELSDVGAQHGYHHVTGTLADGRSIFAKVAPGLSDTVAAAFAAEANGLRWLAEAEGGPPVRRRSRQNALGGRALLRGTVARVHSVAPA